MTHFLFKTTTLLGFVLVSCLMSSSWLTQTSQPEVPRNQSKSLETRINELEELTRMQSTQIEELKTDLGRQRTLISKAQKAADDSHRRVSSLKLVADDTKKSKPLKCGDEDLVGPKDLYFMYGILDGTGCGKDSFYHYKRISLEVPAALQP